MYIKTKSHDARLNLESELGLELGAILHMSWCWITGVCHHTWPIVGTIFPFILVILGKYQYHLVLLHLFICLCMGVCVPQYVYESQKTICRNWSSPSAMWVLRLKLWVPGLWASDFYPLSHFADPCILF